ncbi:MAG: 30S ribosomal protein S12 methylthiotransferase RimO, partial [Clostridia bacterium]|nr:30S ribosomal protein S12 methylthiotransferase RimO [Clostridia bacterium]
MKTEKVGFISLGCSKNLVDSENMIGILTEKGYEITEDIEEAEIIIVNTCAFIDSAKAESIETILDAASYKEMGKCKILICAGCLSERYKDEILSELPELDAIVGVEDYDKIAEAIDEAKKNGNRKFFGGNASDKTLPRVITTPKHTAYLKIAEGCDNFCSYCAIPFIRGRYKSRPMEEVLAEAEELAESGVKELIVIAQDTSRYGIDLYKEKKLPELLKKLCKIENVKWVRVHYCYPEEINDEIIDVFKTEEKIVKYMDIPIQHADDEILKKMNRKTTGEELRTLINKLRKEIPGIAIRTSLIAGFPGETEEQFETLCNFVKEMKFERLGAFAYSAEEGTRAAKMENQIDDDIKEERAGILMDIQNKVAEENGKAFIGKTLTVLTEGFDEESCLYFGRSYMDSLD